MRISVHPFYLRPLNYFNLIFSIVWFFLTTFYIILHVLLFQLMVLSCVLAYCTMSPVCAISFFSAFLLKLILCLPFCTAVPEGPVASSMVIWPLQPTPWCLQGWGWNLGRGEALGSLCTTVLNGFIMQSSRHQGDMWSHNGTRANIIQIFSQSKFNTRPKRGGEEREFKKNKKKKKSVLAYCMRLTVTVVNVK